MDRPVIEELSPDEQPGPFDTELEALLKSSRNDAYKFLSTSFEFLKRKTAFFERADASKQLARLLKEVKTPPAKAANGHAPSSGPSTPSVAASAPPPSMPSSSSQAGPSTSASGQAPAQKEAPNKRPAGDADEEDDASKGLKPTLGNGAQYEHYSFAQTLKDATATFTMPKGTRGRDCDVQLTATSLRVGLKGQAPMVDGPLFEIIKVADSGWSLADGSLDVLLLKENKQQWWKTIMKGDPEINTQKVVPENSKLSDLDDETAAWVEKVQYDNHQKQLGKPTSDEQQKQGKLQEFMKAHPEMDFSKAKFS